MFDDFTTAPFTPSVNGSVSVPVPTGKKVLTVNIQTNQDNEYEFTYSIYMGAYEDVDDITYLQKWFSFSPVDEDGEPIDPADIKISFHAA